MSQDPAIINKSMAKFAPELASKYATYPLQVQDCGRWIAPQESLPSGAAGFIAADNGTVGMKQDYVYGRTESLGSGYFHLRTRTSYQLLFNRLQSEAPPTACCSCDKEAKQEFENFSRVKRIVYNRSVASVSRYL